MISMFAIPNCDTVKKARDFLESNKIAYKFINFKKSPPSRVQIELWSDYAGELPINKKGMTYRKYKEHYETLTTTQKIDFIVENTSLIKRPVLVKDDKVIAFGFSEAEYKKLFREE